jgi:hypothetical protein
VITLRPMSSLLPRMALWEVYAGATFPKERGPRSQRAIGDFRLPRRIGVSDHKIAERCRFPVRN